jgi:hypothetical protein
MQKSTVTRQLGDLKPGTWFVRKSLLNLWVVTNADEEREGCTLCVQPTTGHAELINNSEIVYVRMRPY